MIALAAAAAVVVTLGLTCIGLTAVTAVITRGSGGGARTPGVGMGLRIGCGDGGI